MHLIVGLGNPGDEYEKTRHNFGFWVVDALALRWGFKFKASKFQAMVALGEWEGEKRLLLKPETYMNLSGEAVRPAFDFYKVRPEEVLVVTDDLDLPLGRLRMAASGGSGGHNGMKSISQHLGTQGFPRLRLGIGRGLETPKDFVLSRFSKEEKKLALETVERAADAVECFLKEGIEKAMNRFNGAI